MESEHSCFQSAVEMSSDFLDEIYSAAGLVHSYFQSVAGMSSGFLDEVHSAVRSVHSCFQSAVAMSLDFLGEVYYSFPVPAVVLYYFGMFLQGLILQCTSDFEQNWYILSVTILYSGFHVELVALDNSADLAHFHVSSVIFLADSEFVHCAFDFEKNLCVLSVMILYFGFHVELVVLLDDSAELVHSYVGSVIFPADSEIAWYFDSSDY